MPRLVRLCLIFGLLSGLIFQHFSISTQAQTVYAQPISFDAVKAAAQPRIVIGTSGGRVRVENTLDSGSLFSDTHFYPGKSVRGTLTVADISGGESYFMQTVKAADAEAEEQKRLLSELIICVRDSSGKVLYQGGLLQYQLNFVIPANGETQLIYELTLPETSDNSSRNLSAVFGLQTILSDNLAGLDDRESAADTDDTEPGKEPGKESGTDITPSSDTDSGDSKQEAGDSEDSQSEDSKQKDSDSKSEDTPQKHEEESKRTEVHDESSRSSEHRSISYSEIAGESGPSYGPRPVNYRNEDGSYIVMGEANSVYFSAGSVKGGAKPGCRNTPQEVGNSGIDCGTWVLAGTDDKGQPVWRYQVDGDVTMADGSIVRGVGFLKGGFALIKNPYSTLSDSYYLYYFDSNGNLMLGWIRIGDTWYHSHTRSDGNLGAIETGWVYEEMDGRFYFLDPVSAQMLSGRLRIGNMQGHYRNYYFATLSDTYRQNWFFNTELGRWLYDRLGGRSYGSMYVNEAVPTGERAGSDGALS